MRITIPLYVETGKGESKKEFAVRPLFFPEPQKQNEKLERATRLLANELRTHLTKLGEQERHDELSRWTFSPPLETDRLRLSLELRKRLHKGKFFFASFERLGRRLAFCPGVPGVWFEIRRGETLHERATEVFTEHFREREREDEEDFIDPERLGLPGTAWVTPLDLDVSLPDVAVRVERSRFAFLGDDEIVQGWQELRRVGRCLDELYPEDLDRSLLREHELQELTRLLTAPDRRPVLLLGPPSVGKSALLHEYVWQKLHARRDQPFRNQDHVWLLSPQRLISGMMYVGQWESRLLAILAEAKKRDHVLYFDDLLGLYFAGQSCQSDLSVAHVMKPFIERREVRLLAEATPEVFRVLRERDRGFADLFQIVPLRESNERETTRILVAVQRHLEARHAVRFRLDVLPTVLDLVRRHVRHQSFPGKAATFLRRLAVKHREGAPGRATVLEEFHEQSGLTLSLLDGQQKLPREEVLAALGKEIVGQSHALEAAADVLTIAKARLNDPERPLASLLFLGPTGVGKTQCARALARFLFGDPERLLRFDMNEYNTPGSASRLAGTFDQPEGPLTAAVRRQPFAVVLLDEIEKADPEVFDLLLQVLGEGRLTDALGRTVDFTSTLIVLTSNLGVREAQQTLGFRAGDGHDRGAYTQAAQRFFRPEFFNRLDRIVPFERLTRAEVARIARMVLEELLRREGLVRRKCVLQVEPSALERIIDSGFDPVLGARALKRAVERQLVRPIAAQLAGGLEPTICVLAVFPQGEGVTLDVAGLAEVAPLDAEQRALGETRNVLEAVGQRLQKIEERFTHLRPRGEITAASLAGEHLFYFLVQDQVRALRARRQELLDLVGTLRRSTSGTPSLPLATTARIKRKSWDHSFRGQTTLLREMAGAEDLRLYLADVAESAVRFAESDRQRLVDLVEELALLQVICDAQDRPEGEAVLVYLRSWGNAGKEHVDLLAELYWTQGFVRHPGSQEGDRVEVDIPDAETERALVVRGQAMGRLTSFEAGTHLFASEQAGLVAVQVCCWPIADDAEPKVILQERRAARRAWIDQVNRGEVGAKDDPMKPGPVVRVYDVGKNYFDLRTQSTGEGMPDVPGLILMGLPRGKGSDHRSPENSE